MSDNDLRLHHSRHLVLPATPANPNGDPLHRLDRGHPFKFTGLCGYSSEQIGAVGAVPQNGYSTNHSILTGGILMEIQARNWRFLGEPQAAPSLMLTTADQLLWFLSEPGVSHQREFDIDAALHIKAGFKPLPVKMLGLSIETSDTLPRFTLVESAKKDGTYEFERVRSGDGAPYVMSFITHPNPECSWAIIHRDPVPISFGCLSNGVPIHGACRHMF